MLKNFLFYCVLWLHCLSYMNNIYTQKFILDHCIKYWRTQVFMIMSLYGRIRVSENRYSRIFYTVIYSQEQSSQNVHKICRYYFLSKKKEQNRLKWNWFSEVRLGLEASNITKNCSDEGFFFRCFEKFQNNYFVERFWWTAYTWYGKYGIFSMSVSIVYGQHQRLFD